MTTLRHWRTPLIATIVTALTAATASCSSDDTAPSSDDSNSTAYPVTVENFFGDVTIDSKPERIMSLEPTSADITLYLEEELAVYSEWKPMENYQTLDPSLHPDGDILNYDMWSGNTELNIEAIAEQEPDLIIFPDWIDDDTTIERLQQIAPSISTTSGDASDQEYTYNTVQALGYPEETSSRIEDEVESRLDELGDYVTEGRDLTYQAFSPMPDGGSVRQIPANDVGTDLGFRAVGMSSDVIESNEARELSLENIGDLREADVLFVGGYIEQNDWLLNDPNWKALPAVQNDLVFWPLDDEFRGSLGARMTPNGIKYMRDNAADIIKERLVSAGILN